MTSTTGVACMLGSCRDKRWVTPLRACCSSSSRSWTSPVTRPVSEWYSWCSPGFSWAGVLSWSCRIPPGSLTDALFGALRAARPLKSSRLRRDVVSIRESWSSPSFLLSQTSGWRMIYTLLSTVWTLRSRENRSVAQSIGSGSTQSTRGSSNEVPSQRGASTTRGRCAAADVTRAGSRTPSLRRHSRTLAQAS